MLSKQIYFQYKNVLVRSYKKNETRFEETYRHADSFPRLKVKPVTKNDIIFKLS